MHPWTMQFTVDEIARRLEHGQFTQHVVVNVAKLVHMRHDLELRSAVTSCDIINIDGMGVVFGGRFLNLDIPERVAGIDLFYRLLTLASQRGERVFLLGARAEVLEQAVANLRQQYPSLQIAGYHHGYFWDDEMALVDKVRQSGASMLFVGVTSPKKEQFIERRKNQLGVKFVMGVGGTFDIVAGITRRAPVWMQRSGLEWFYRVLQEPGRMWKRYLFTNVMFLFLILREKIRPFEKRHG
ncbi:MAG: WecB/TagA/CpsF family glycosyltransferase [Magnetococcales bacterium]|nr:WecB/TagA/CpsF family glycosyltransferase [Magnetococcales bacterium]